MQNELEKKVTLGIETAVLGGSLSLFANGKELDSWLGGSDVSRSEDLVISISELIERNALARADIGRIVVSTGPGSYTGIRVGIATALGLQNALSVSCVGISILEAMSTAGGENVVAAVPVGRGDICRTKPASLEITVENDEKFLEFLSGRVHGRVMLHEQIFERLAPRIDGHGIENVGENLARFLAMDIKKREGDLTPIYVRDFV